MGRLPTAVLVVCACVCACGRLDFPATSGPALPCGSAARVAMDAPNTSALVGVVVPNGFALFRADTSGQVFGASFPLVNGTVETGATTMLATGATGALGAAANGSWILVTSEMGMPSATGTQLFPLGATLSAAGSAAPRDGVLAATMPVAAGTTERFAFVTIDSATGAVIAQQVSAAGANVGSAVSIVDGSYKASTVSIVATPAGYVVSFYEGATHPHQSEIVLLDHQLAVTAGPVAIPNNSYDEFKPVVAYANGTYLAAWEAKDVTDDDDVWIQLLDATLSPIGGPQMIAAFSQQEVVTGDDTGFWIAWRTYKPSPNHLGAARVAIDGTITPRAVTMSGGTPAQWTMLEHASQPVLAWIESGGSGPNVYFDPLCAP